jgi:hypothetical protein
LANRSSFLAYLFSGCRFLRQRQGYRSLFSVRQWLLSILFGNALVFLGFSSFAVDKGQMLGRNKWIIHFLCTAISASVRALFLESMTSIETFRNRWFSSKTWINNGTLTFSFSKYRATFSSTKIWPKYVVPICFVHNLDRSLRLYRWLPAT